jgi:succinyl-diaminopimelate desuccinylase
MTGVKGVEDQILNKVEELSEAMIADIRELVRIDSVEKPSEEDAPFGQGVKEALLKALKISEKLGFNTKNLENHIGYAQYGEGEDYVGAIGHLDVVPEGDGWKHPPFSGYLEDGVIYSRGILDNKGPIMSCLYGMYALKELGLNGEHPIRIIFGCDEETGFLDLEYYLKKEKPPIYGFTPDCKYPVVYSERGRSVVRISDERDNLEWFFEFVNTYFIGAKNTGDRLGIDFSSPEYGIMEMRNYNLHQMEREVYFEVTFSYPPGITIEEILEKIKIKAVGMNVTVMMNFDPGLFEKDSPMVSTLQACYEKVTNNDGTPVTTTGGTYAKLMPNIVPFGPSFPGQKGIGHNPNEWMKVEDLVTNAKIYALALYRLSQQK